MSELLASKSGVTVKLERDQHAESPHSWDNLGTMVCFHKRYNLGDEHSFATPDDFKDWWKTNGKGGELLSLYLYDHSGITMSCKPFSCPWDSGQVGWIYATAETIRKEYGKRITKKNRESTIRVLQGEVKTYDQFLTGDVYGYIIEDEDGETLDSCWGFFGYEYAKEEAMDMFKYFADKAEATSSHVESANECETDLTV